MTVSLSPIWNGFTFQTNDGMPLAHGLVYTYDNGTTTPKSTFTTRSGTTANTNPLVLDANGRMPQEIWLTDSSSYTLVLKTATDDTLMTCNDIMAIPQGSVLPLIGEPLYDSFGMLIVYVASNIPVNNLPSDFTPITTVGSRFLGWLSKTSSNRMTKIVTDIFGGFIGYAFPGAVDAVDYAVVPVDVFIPDLPGALIGEPMYDILNHVFAHSFAKYPAGSVHSDYLVLNKPDSTVAALIKLVYTVDVTVAIQDIYHTTLGYAYP